MSTAKKTLYAAVGAGTTTIAKARELPRRVIDLAKRQDVTLAIDIRDIRELPKTVAAFGRTLPEKATGLIEDVRELSAQAQTRATKAFTQITKRGETVVKKVERSAPTKKAKAQTKTAKAKVKAATTSVKKAVEADVTAVKAAAGTVENSTEQAS